jgi:hypothetical protein
MGLIVLRDGVIFPDWKVEHEKSTFRICGRFDDVNHGAG